MKRLAAVILILLTALSFGGCQTKDSEKAVSYTHLTLPTTERV